MGSERQKAEASRGSAVAPAADALLRTPAPLSAPWRRRLLPVSQHLAAKARFSPCRNQKRASAHATRCLAGPSNIHVPPNTVQMKQKTGASTRGFSSNRVQRHVSTSVGVDSTVAVLCSGTRCLHSHSITESQQASVREDRRSYLPVLVTPAHPKRRFRTGTTVT